LGGELNLAGPRKLDLLSSEESHHLKNSNEVDHEDDDVQNDVEFRAKFNVLASEHAGKMQSCGGAVKEIELRHFGTAPDEWNSAVRGCDLVVNV
jgi:hypothetical protein